MGMNRFAWTAPEGEPRLSEPRPRAIKELEIGEIGGARESAEASKSVRARETGGAREDPLELGGEDTFLKAGQKASRRWRARVHGSSRGWRGLHLAALVPSWPTGAPGRCGCRAAWRGQVACDFLVPQLDLPLS